MQTKCMSNKPPIGAVLLQSGGKGNGVYYCPDDYYSYMAMYICVHVELLALVLDTAVPNKISAVSRKSILRYGCTVTSVLWLTPRGPLFKATLALT